MWFVKIFTLSKDCKYDSINYNKVKKIDIEEKMDSNFQHLTISKNLELQYRGRIRELKELKPVRSGISDLMNAMKMISETEKGPKDQIPSMGCNIKWLK